MTGGLGSRLAMRIIAVTAGSDMQGVLTEQEVPVGEITAGGTVFLILLADSWASCRLGYGCG